MIGHVTLTEFLTARFDDDERRARDLSSWTLAESAVLNWAERLGYDEDEDFDLKHESKTFTSLLAHVGMPARVLAEVEAKRRILEDCSDCLKADDEFDAQRLMAGDILRLLALPYADHPDYRDEWRP